MKDKSTHSRPTRGDKRWDMLVLDEYGKIIPIRRFKGVAIGMAIGLVIALAGLVLVSWLYLRSQASQGALQDQINAAQDTIAALRHEKDIIMAKLVVTQTEAEQKAASKGTPADPKAPAKTTPKASLVSKASGASAKSAAKPVEPLKRAPAPAKAAAKQPPKPKAAPVSKKPAPADTRAPAVAKAPKPSASTAPTVKDKPSGALSQSRGKAAQPVTVVDVPGADTKDQPAVTSDNAAPSKTPPADTITLSETPSIKVDVEIVSVQHDPGESELKVRFKIKKILPPKGPVKGRTVFILKADQSDQGTWVTSPSVELVDGRPTGERGQRFSIVRFRVAEFKLEGQTTPQLFKTATVFVYTMEGDLLLEKDFDITVGSV
jgi:hypothetical protein